jgi:cell division septation protein DedD
VRLEVLDAPVQVASRRATAPRVRRAAPARRPVEPAAPPPAEPAGTYTVLVATLSDGAKAEHLRSRIALKFDDAHVSRLDVGVDRHYRVRIGPYPTRAVAHAQATRVNRFGYPAVITDESAP